MEHEETRRRLKASFESLFARFDHPFSSDEEIDILKLKVVKRKKKIKHEIDMNRSTEITLENPALYRKVTFGTLFVPQPSTSPAADEMSKSTFSGYGQIYRMPLQSLSRKRIKKMPKSSSSAAIFVPFPLKYSIDEVAKAEETDLRIMFNGQLFDLLMRSTAIDFDPVSALRCSSGPVSIFDETLCRLIFPE